MRDTEDPNIDDTRKRSHSADDHRCLHTNEAPPDVPLGAAGFNVNNQNNNVGGNALNNGTTDQRNANVPFSAPWLQALVAQLQAASTNKYYSFAKLVAGHTGGSMNVEMLIDTVFLEAQDKQAEKSKILGDLLKLAARGSSDLLNDTLGHFTKSLSVLPMAADPRAAQSSNGGISFDGTRRVVANNGAPARNQAGMMNADQRGATTGQLSSLDSDDIVKEANKAHVDLFNQFSELLDHSGIVDDLGSGGLGSLPAVIGGSANATHCVWSDAMYAAAMNTIETIRANNGAHMNLDLLVGHENRYPELHHYEYGAVQNLFAKICAFHLISSRKEIHGIRFTSQAAFNERKANFQLDIAQVRAYFDPNYTIEIQRPSKVHKAVYPMALVTPRMMRNPALRTQFLAELMQPDQRALGTDPYH